jgi:hypothetical protein
MLGEPVVPGGAWVLPLPRPFSAEEDGRPLGRSDIEAFSSTRSEVNG